MKTELGFIDADIDKIFALAAGKGGGCAHQGSQGNYRPSSEGRRAGTPGDRTSKTKRDGALRNG
ncbi:MAG: hypothetical protein IPG72_14460 [Ardenticatenales bacterium]|nr:hypothetical protein [Ardenticatenales bacterium]